METTFTQHLENLPQELLEQKRFFQLFGKNKGDTPKGWSNPDNQKLYTEIQQGYLAGLIIFSSTSTTSSTITATSFAPTLKSVSSGLTQSLTPIANYQ